MSDYRSLPVEAPSPIVADIALRRGERVMLVLLPALFLLITLGVPALYLVDLVTRQLAVGPLHLPRELWELGAFVFAPLLGALVLVAILLWVLHGFDLRTRVHRNGLAIRYRGKERWVGFDGLRSARETPFFIGRRLVASNYVLDPLDGASFSLVQANSFAGLSTDVGRLDTLAEAFRSSYGAHRGAQHLEAIERGERVDYGLGSADARGLRLGDVVLPWTSITQMVVRRRRVFTLRIEATGHAPLELPLDRVLDYPALAHVAARRMTRRR